MTEREAILEAIRKRETTYPQHVIALHLDMCNRSNSAVLIETMRNCLSILSARVAGEDALLVADERSSYDQWISGMTEIAEALLESVKDAAENPML